MRKAGEATERQHFEICDAAVRVAEDLKARGHNVGSVFLHPHALATLSTLATVPLTEDERLDRVLNGESYRGFSVKSWRNLAELQAAVEIEEPDGSISLSNVRLPATA